jgi:sec-independent protein translocase protein TatA
MGLENPLHIALLVVLLLLVFGAKRLPEIGRSLGSGMREFKDSISTSTSTDSHAGAASEPVKGAQPALAQATQPPQPPVAQPAPTQAPVTAPAPAPAQPAEAPVEQSHSA